MYVHIIFSTFLNYKSSSRKESLAVPKKFSSLLNENSQEKVKRPTKISPETVRKYFPANRKQRGGVEKFFFIVLTCTMDILSRWNLNVLQPQKDFLKRWFACENCIKITDKNFRMENNHNSYHDGLLLSRWFFTFFNNMNKLDFNDWELWEFSQVGSSGALPSCLENYDTRKAENSQSTANCHRFWRLNFRGFNQTTWQRVTWSAVASERINHSCDFSTCFGDSSGGASWCLDPTRKLVSSHSSAQLIIT